MIDTLETGLNVVGLIIVSSLFIQYGINVLSNNKFPFSLKNTTAIAFILLGIRMLLK